MLGASSVDGEVLLLNTGSGFSPASAQRFNVTERTREAVVADINRDGALDFVQVGADTGDIVVWLNDGTGRFTASATIRIPGTQTIALTDVDRDGWVDLVIAGGTGADTLHIWRNDHTGNFVHIRSLMAGPIVQLAAADFDGDGDNDLVTISGTAPDQLWTNDGAGGFAATTLPWTSTGASASSQLAIADLNNDGAPDLLLPQGARPIFWTPGIYFPGFATSLEEGGVKGFAATDFTSVTVANPGFALTGFRVTALPVKGVLKLNGAPVTLNQDLTLAQLGTLSFASTKDLYGDDSFSVAPRDGSGLSPSGRVALAISRVVDSPVASAQTVSAFVQVPKTITLVGVHPENEAMTFTVTTLPAHGTLSGTGTERIYTANIGFLGTDTFVFRVADNFGGSSIATVTINVTDNVRTVTSTADTGAGTLREQLAYAAAQGGAWRIAFPASLANQTITLSTPGDTAVGASAFAITQDIELDASAAGAITFQRANSVDELRFFRIAAGARLALKNITLRGGHARGTTARGGAIYNAGTLELTHASLDLNEALGTADAEGGGIYSQLGTVIATDASFSSNRAGDNSVPGTGGALYLVNGTATSTRVSFSGNAASTSGSDVQLVANNPSTPSLTRWVSSIVPGLAVANSGGRVEITSHGSTLPANLPAYVSPIATQFITGDATVPFTVAGPSVGLLKATGEPAPTWLSVAVTGTFTRGLRFQPPEGTSGAQVFSVKNFSSVDATYYFEEFEANFAVAVSAAPTARDQSFTTVNGQPLAIVLDTTVASSLTATYTIVDRATRGSLSGTAPNLTYTPTDGSFSGSDEFVYTVTDSRGRSASGHVRIVLQQSTYTVTSSEQLNAALDLAQSTAGNVTISIGASARLTRLTLNSSVNTPVGPAGTSVANTVTIDGSAAPGVVIERSGSSRRLFHIQAGGQLILRHLILSGGDAVGADGAAGANGGTGLGGLVYNSGGTLQAEFVTFTQSTARGGAGGVGGNGGSAFGGAIYNAAGTLLISDATFIDNFVTGGGGVIAGVAEGGAIFSRNGTVSLTRTVFTYTQAIAFAHVSIFGDGAAATLNLDATPLSVLTSATLNSGTAVINAGNSLVTGPGLTSIAPVSNFTISGVGTIPLPLTNGPLTALTVTSLNPTAVPNAWLSATGSLSAPAVKVTTVAPAIGVTAGLRVSATKGGTVFNRDVPVTLAAHVNPVALAQTVTLQVNLAQPITLGATYPAGITPTYTIATPPTHGALGGTAPNLTYTPVNGYLGNDTFTFRVTDDAGATSDAAVTLTVQATGVPFFENGNLPTVTAKGQAFDLFSSANHTGGISELAFLTYALVPGQGPAHGTVTVTDYEISPGLISGLIHYDPATSTVGTDAFTIRVTDHYGQTATCVYHIVLMDPATNTAPVITGLPSGLFAGSTTLITRPFAAATAVDPESPPQNLFIELPLPDATKGEFVGFETLANVYPTTNFDPVSGDPIYSLAIIGSPAEVTASLRAIGYHQTAALAPGQSNDVPVVVRISDDFTFDTPTNYTFTLRITAPALPPVAGAASVTTLMNTPVAIMLAATHPQGLPLVYTIPTAQQHGTLSGTMPNLIYTPASGYFGPDSFLYRVADATGNFASATVSIFVNRRPVAIDDVLTRPAGQIAKISIAALLANDSDPDGDALTFVGVAATSAQGVVLSAIDGWVYYPAPSSLAANDTFTYSIRDARGAVTTGTVSVVVQSPPPAVRTILSVTARTGGQTGVTLRLAGVAGRSYTVQVSDDLVTWSALATATADNLGLYTVDDPSAPADGVGRFYRAVKNN